jgi:hypothetical protein
MHLSSNLSMTWIGHDVSSSPAASLHQAHTHRVVFLLFGQGNIIQMLRVVTQPFDKHSPEVGQVKCSYVEIIWKYPSY